MERIHQRKLHPFATHVHRCVEISLCLGANTMMLSSRINRFRSRTRSYAHWLRSNASITKWKQSQAARRRAARYDIYSQFYWGVWLGLHRPDRWPSGLSWAVRFFASAFPTAFKWSRAAAIFLRRCSLGLFHQHTLHQRAPIVMVSGRPSTGNSP